MKVSTNDARINRFAMIVILIIDGLMLAGYTSKCAKGGLSLSFTVSFDIAVIIALIADIVAIKIWPARFKYVALIGYSLIYAQAVVRAETDLTFAIAFPIAVVFILYYDLKLIAILSAIFVALNVFDLVYQMAVLKEHHSGMPLEYSALLLQFLPIAVFMIALVFVTKISNQNNSNALNRVQSMADRVTGGIEEINEKLTALNESSGTMKNSMMEVNSGINDTSDAVQNQLYQTEAIQNKLEEVQKETHDISANVSETIVSVSAGTKEVEQLVQSSERSVGISEEVVQKLGELQESMDEMNKITKFIDSIAFQTNIMALNANVEAARAGEAGRGFAVVAGEISAMSDKTKDATQKIEDIIVNVGASLGELVSSIDEMAGNIASGKERTDETAAVFSKIEANTDAMKAHVEMLLGNIENLTEANREIVASVQTISATSEQVSALASEALEVETGNAEALSKVADLVSDLAKE